MYVRHRVYTSQDAHIWPSSIYILQDTSQWPHVEGVDKEEDRMEHASPANIHQSQRDFFMDNLMVRILVDRPFTIGI